MLGSDPEAVPNLIIVNAPKSNQITMINYYDDLCLSEPGPRASQLFFVYLQEWNMLLVASANSHEIGVLATTESGDAPTWVQYVTERCMSSPMVMRSNQSYPLGITPDTSGVQISSAEGVLSEPLLSIHLLASYGDLISYTVANKLPNMKDLCSPPPPAQDQSGLSQFVTPAPILDEQTSPPAKQTNQLTVTPKPAAVVQQPSPPVNVTVTKESDMTFNFGGVASTPIVPQKATSVFGGAAQAPATGGMNLFGGSTFDTNKQAPVTNTVKPTSTMVFPKTSEFPTMSGQKPQIPIGGPPLPTVTPVTAAATPPPPTKPLISVPPKFASPSVAPTVKKTPQQKISEDEDNEVSAEMMREDIAKADKEIRELINLCRGISVTVGTAEEKQAMMKDLSGLVDFSQQAVESSDQLGSEVRMLNLSLNEAFSTVKNANDFFASYQNPEKARLRDYMAPNQANRRQTIRLESALVANEQQMRFIQKQLIAQWNEFDAVRKQYSKDRMHVPCLEGVYETLTRQKEILFRERQKINFITSKLGVRLLSKVAESDNHEQNDSNLESMANSMLSMSLNETVTNAQKKVDPKKLRQLTEYLANRPVTVVSPARPKNGLTSDVILARKEKMIMAKRAMVVKKLETSAVAGESLVKTKVPVVTTGMGQQQKAAAPTANKPFGGLQPQQQPAGVTAAPQQKPFAVASTTTKPVFGGFGDIRNQSKPTETKTQITTAVKENIAQNLITKPKATESSGTPPTSGFSGFGNLMQKKEEPVKAVLPVTTSAAPAFSFNIPQATTIKPVAAEAKTLEKTTATTTAAAPSTLFALPKSVTVTAIPTTTTATKSFFGGSATTTSVPFGTSSINVTGAGDQKAAVVTKAAPINETAVLDSLKICSPTVNAAPSATLPSMTVKPTPTTSAGNNTVDAKKDIFSSNAFSSLLGSTSAAVPAPPVITAPASVITATTIAVSSPATAKVETKATTSMPTAAPTSIFGGFEGSKPAEGGNTTPGGSLFGTGFGASPSTGASGGSIFGTASAAPPAPATTTTTGEGIKSLFGGMATSTAPAVITSPTTTTPLPKPDQSVFGQAAATVVTTTPAPTSTAASTFSFGNMGLGSTTPAAAPFGAATGSTNIFGGAAPATTNVFGGGGSGGSLFGGTGSTFGASPAAAAGGTTSTSIFGGASPGAASTPPAASGGSIFGGGGGGGGIFGGAATGTTPGGSIFGGQASATTATNNSPFGAPTGGSAASTGNLFGAASTGQSTGGGSLFGGGGASTAGASSGFSFVNASAAPAFGAPASAAASPFGAPAQPQVSAFGQAAQSPFGGGSGGVGAGAGMFGQPAGE